VCMYVWICVYINIYINIYIYIYNMHYALKPVAIIYISHMQFNYFFKVSATMYWYFLDVLSLHLFI